MENTAKFKSKRFAVRIVRLYQYLRNDKREFVLSKQLLRSGTSIGANIAEAIYGSSRRDFVAKPQIAKKEAAESMYWLELLNSCDFISDDMHRSM